MARFRLVTFDVTNTLLHFRTSVGQTYAETASLFKIKVEVDEANRAFKRHFKDLNREHPCFGARSGISSEEWWANVVSRTIRDSSQSPATQEVVDSISRKLFTAYASKAQWAPNPGSQSLLHKLKKSGVTLGVISNFDERLNSVLDQTKLKDHFDFVIASYAVKAAKPDRAIFDQALQKVSHLGIPGSQALHIGDDYELDYLGAKNAGWSALLISGDTEKYYAVPDFLTLEKRLFV